MTQQPTEHLTRSQNLCLVRALEGVAAAAHQQGEAVLREVAAVVCRQQEVVVLEAAEAAEAAEHCSVKGRHARGEEEVVVAVGHLPPEEH